jgi:hypothetical protein
MCPNGTTCLPTDCCFSDLALYKSNSACWSRTKRASSSFHWMQLVLAMMQLKNCSFGVNNNHSLTPIEQKPPFCRKLACWYCRCTPGNESVQWNWQQRIGWTSEECFVYCWRYWYSYYVYTSTQTYKWRINKHPGNYSKCHVFRFEYGSVLHNKYYPSIKSDM